MEVIKGDLVALAKEGCFDMIVHGANCWNSMSGGIAATIAKEVSLKSYGNNSEEEIQRLL